MRIGIDARLYRSSTAGIGRYTQNLIKNILEIDQENQYVLFMTPEDAREFKETSNNTQDTNYKVVSTDIAHYSIAEQTRLAKIIEDEKLDLVHFTNFNIPLNYKGKFVVTIHDLTLFFYPGRSRRSFIYKLAYKYIFRKACEKSSKIIAVSQSTKGDIENVFHIGSKKIKVIYEAADDKTFINPGDKTLDKISKKFNLNEPVVLYVGQWRSHKNLVGLIKAFNILRQKLPCRLALVGKPDPAYPEVQQTIDKSPAVRDIIVPGFVSEEELSAWYKKAMVFAFPSFYEGFGLPGVEAMMAGTAVVASDRTSLPEIYKNGQFTLIHWI